MPRVRLWPVREIYQALALWHTILLHQLLPSLQICAMAQPLVSLLFVWQLTHLFYASSLATFATFRTQVARRCSCHDNWLACDFVRHVVCLCHAGFAFCNGWHDGHRSHWCSRGGRKCSRRGAAGIAVGSSTTCADFVNEMLASLVCLFACGCILVWHPGCSSSYSIR